MVDISGLIAGDEVVLRNGNVQTIAEIDHNRYGGEHHPVIIRYTNNHSRIHNEEGINKYDRLLDIIEIVCRERPRSNKFNKWVAITSESL